MICQAVFCVCFPSHTYSMCVQEDMWSRITGLNPRFCHNMLQDLENTLGDLSDDYTLGDTPLGNSPG